MLWGLATLVTVLGISCGGHEMNQIDITVPRILRLKQLQQLLSISRSTIYDRMNSSSPRYDPDFPKPVKLGGYAVGWIELDVVAWIECKRKG